MFKNQKVEVEIFIENDNNKWFQQRKKKIVS